MRTYEVVCLIRSEDELFNRGKETVKKELEVLEAKFLSEDDMGKRNLAYPVKGQEDGHYYLFNVEMLPEKAYEIENQLRLKTEILKVLVVRKDK